MNGLFAPQRLALARLQARARLARALGRDTTRVDAEIAARIGELQAAMNAAAWAAYHHDQAAADDANANLND